MFRLNGYIQFYYCGIFRFLSATEAPVKGFPCPSWAEPLICWALRKYKIKLLISKQKLYACFGNLIDSQSRFLIFFVKRSFGSGHKANCMFAGRKVTYGKRKKITGEWHDLFGGGEKIDCSFQEII